MGPERKEDEQLPQPKRILVSTLVNNLKESYLDSDNHPSCFDPNTCCNTALEDTTAKCLSHFIDVAFKNVFQKDPQ